jgi:hypothetical protein
MIDEPSRKRRDTVDDGWGFDDALVASGVRGRSSPTRGGTMPWDDRALDVQGADAPPASARLAQPVSPVRSGTAPWDQLLTSAVRHRHEALADEAARAARPVRGGTRSWDELLAAMRAEEIDRISVEPGVVFGAAVVGDPFDDLASPLLDFLKPDDAAKR